MPVDQSSHIVTHKTQPKRLY